MKKFQSAQEFSACCLSLILGNNQTAQRTFATRKVQSLASKKAQHVKPVLSKPHLEARKCAKKRCPDRETIPTPTAQFDLKGVVCSHVAKQIQTGNFRTAPEDSMNHLRVNPLTDNGQEWSKFAMQPKNTPLSNAASNTIPISMYRTSQVADSYANDLTIFGHHRSDFEEFIRGNAIIVSVQDPNDR